MARKASTTAPQDPPPGYAIDPKAVPMLRYQASLPNLPIPPLESTCSKYLESVRPLLTPSEFANTKTAVEEFVASPHAAELQKLLQQRAAEPGRDSWLSEWWNDVAYMGYRDPVVVFVSYYFVHVDDAVKSRGRDQAKRAASLIKAMLPFRDLTESGRLEPEKVRGNPLCMASYKWLFHSSRYPTKPSDTARKFDAKTHNHIVVVRKNKFFVVPLTNAQGHDLSYSELEAQFNKVKSLAGSESSPVSIGSFTADNRDSWTDNRAKLIAASPKNAELLEKIESAMIVVALDDGAPVTRDQVSWETWTGNARNRFFDKHQIVVFENGKSGFLGEHSCMDGTPTLRMNEFILGSIDKGKVDLAETPVSGELPAVEELTFEVNPQVTQALKEAERRYAELLGDHHMKVLNYEGYGKDLMKKYKISPDAWAQMVKQLAFHKLEGRPGVCYESCQTRKFKLGRTEVIRSVSEQSKEWVDAMEGGISDPKKVRELFRSAVARHGQYAAWAADAQGVDRHLFGLKMLIPNSSQPKTVPKIYTDKAFGQSNHWELSTSQLSSKYFDGWGYGEVVPDGFGLSYSIGDDYVRWTVTSSTKGGRGKEANEKLVHYLAEAAGEVRKMMEAAAKADAAAAVPKPETPRL
ncbi:acyltransferase ChoActase/COT/CPT [Coprinellus micaceus]|uniref:Carnitine O-acetyltransferase, mitochondrial n=1 Tax=Coprinellus micaceus TaxID=71717 RepID=A0A4Y7T8R5_COPMI|nr:acyltransferase ChoActase/COT/CPT [Coprinellus micaceus]